VFLRAVGVLIVAGFHSHYSLIFLKARRLWVIIYIMSIDLIVFINNQIVHHILSCKSLIFSRNPNNSINNLYRNDIDLLTIVRRILV
jgi:hypothetical protein